MTADNDICPLPFYYRQLLHRPVIIHEFSALTIHDAVSIDPALSARYGSCRTFPWNH